MTGGKLPDQNTPGGHPGPAQLLEMHHGKAVADHLHDNHP